MTKHQTRSQRVAEAAFNAVEGRATEPKKDKYLAFAREFPTLIHTCGLAQATAFALAKGKVHGLLLDDLAKVSRGEDGKQFQKTVREAPLMDYLALTREALFAATWIKRYAEALLKSKEQSATDGVDAEPGGSS